MLNQLINVKIPDLDRFEATAVAEDRDAICDLKHLAEPVRDIDD